MHRNYFQFIVLAAILCLVLIFVSLWREIESPATKEPNIPPPVAPFKSSISGTGIVEPSSGNILVGTSLNKIVSSINVKVGDKVKKGDILFTLDDRDLKANLETQKAAYDSSLAKLKRLEAFPRKEDLLAATAVAADAKAELNLAESQYKMVQSLPDPRAISEEEKLRRLSNYQQAEAKWQQAQADLEKIQSGTWKPDLEIASTELQEAKASVIQIQTEIDRSIIRAPIEGTVLQINIHKGEMVQSDNLQKPAMIIGNTNELYLRVSIDQLDIPFFNSKEPAVAYFQDNAKLKFPLEFVSVDPFLVPKRNLTNDLSETIDTRVLQIIYRIKNGNYPIYVGQQMEAFIDTSDRNAK